MPITLKSDSIKIKNGDAYSPIDAFYAGDVEKWLDEHPEATTTVEDGSISKRKLASDTATIYEYYVPDAETLQSILTDVNSNCPVYRLGDIVIDAPIELSSNATVRNKRFRFIGGRITINSNYAFTLPTSDYYGIPSFSGTEFLGNNHTIFYNSNGCYLLQSFFTDCLFKNVKLVTNGTCIQSLKFSQCKFIASDTSNTFIKCGIIRDSCFETCQFDSDFKSTLLDVNGYFSDAYRSAFYGFNFNDCLVEGRTSEFAHLIVFASGEINITGLYAEQCEKPILYKKYSADYGNLNHSTVVVDNSFFLLGVDHYLCAYDPESIAVGNTNKLIV